jgi:hypothetical protein
LLVIRAASSEIRAVVNETHARRGYCVSSTRNGFQIETSSAAANASHVAAPSASSAIQATAHCSPATGDSTIECSIGAAARATRAVRALLHAATGRHALDEAANVEPCRLTTPGALTDIAVKNLRIVGSAVLLLNFREVRRFHLCSTSVAV